MTWRAEPSEYHPGKRVGPPLFQDFTLQYLEVGGTGVMSQFWGAPHFSSSLS